MTKPLLEVRNLQKIFKVQNELLKAVDDVSFEVFEKETFGLVGESGCGKTTIARTLLQISPPSHGEIYFEDRNLFDKTSTKRRDIQLIFQDPNSSLNPKHRIAKILQEPLLIHKVGNKESRFDLCKKLLKMVGLSSDYLHAFPHELSGGQKQKVGIARALSLNPKFIVCDEPLAALDVSIQAQIVNLLKKLQHDLGLTFLFISHDLAMVKYISKRIGVMYLGSLVEITTSEKLYEDPKHPYSQALLSSVSIPDPSLEKTRKKSLLKGEIPSLLNPPKGCAFCSRCPKAMLICKTKKPILKEIAKGHKVACHLY